MAHRKHRGPRSRARLTPRVKVWLEVNGRYGFGFGIAEILRAVEQAGSIKQAAGDLGKSYRYVWSRIKEAEDAIGQSLVETQVGGQGTQRSFLTETARRFVAEFLAMRGRMLEVMEKEFAKRFAPAGTV
ncbi:MAG: LysR family transcriptional regulator [Planctomycetes bacterium]|nr:LysR family transcriptional regulator [Planctomycetota bacterium]